MKNREELIENNKLIAEFMGLAYCEKHQYEGWYKNSEFNYKVCDHDELQYHTSWDWLMLVVEQIENEGASVIIGRFFCEIKYQDPLYEAVNFEIRIASGKKKNAVYGAVVEFIKWYSKIKKI